MPPDENGGPRPDPTPAGRHLQTPEQKVNPKGSRALRRGAGIVAVAAAADPMAVGAALIWLVVG